MISKSQPVLSRDLHFLISKYFNYPMGIFYCFEFESVLINHISRGAWEGHLASPAHSIIQQDLGKSRALPTFE